MSARGPRAGGLGILVRWRAALVQAARRGRARAGRRGLALGDPDEGPARETLRREAREQVRAALADLSERQRACLLLRHAGYSYAEIAATLGVAIGSVGVLLARAERAFRERYRERYPEPDHDQEHTDDRHLS